MTGDEALAFLISKTKISEGREIIYPGAPGLTDDWRAVSAAEKAGLICMVRYHNTAFEVMGSRIAEDEWLERDISEDRRKYKLTKLGLAAVAALEKV